MNQILRKTVFISNQNTQPVVENYNYKVLHGGWWFQETFYNNNTYVSYNYKIEDKKLVLENNVPILVETLTPIHEDLIVMPCMEDPITYCLTIPLELEKHPQYLHQWKTPSFVVTQSMLTS